MTTTGLRQRSAKRREGFTCSGCGYVTPKWAGKCVQCGAWNSLAEVAGASGRSVGATDERPQPIGDVDASGGRSHPTGLSELDRVLDGGLVAGSVTLLGGEPGIGKSTLVLQLAHQLALRHGRALYVTAEESSSQVRNRAERLGAVCEGLWLVAGGDLASIDRWVGEVDPAVLIVDSIQTVHDPDGASAPGSPSQVRDSTHRLVELAKSRSMITVIVGQVTKDGDLAGPKALEHVVDTVLSFEGDRHQQLRFLRASKHRFGGTGELGLFEMSAEGLHAMDDPSAVFLADRVPGVPGSVVVPVVEGDRPLLVEVQALALPTGLPNPRRSAQGLDSGRLGLLAAVLDRRCGLELSKFDVFASAVGGVRVSEPAADLALVAAVASTALDQPFPADTVACGEIGLVGEVRGVTDLARRLSEAARLGFARALVPQSTVDGPPGLELLRIQHISEALRVLRTR